MARDQKRRKRRPESARRFKKKVCYFCREKIEYIDYKDVAVLRKYMSDRAKIRSRRVTGNCAHHQREVALAIKNAREMALMPYTNR
jgi:ribosomal protein S18